MPCANQEMSAGVVTIHHSPDNKNHLKIHKTEDACWECDEWYDLPDAEILGKLTKVMDSFNDSKKGNNQPATPHIELTYPLACFNNPELLGLSSLPENTQFKLMDLPGLRNVQDSTNSDVIKNCSDALCLVAYDMAETDETKRLKLVSQVLDQVKNMGGSPARMLFVLNKIDAFNQDREADRRRDEHIDKVKAEIKGILHKELPEQRDTLDNLTYNSLSSLPALYAQQIKTGSDRVRVAEKLEEFFKSLIPKEVLNDLPRTHHAWKDHDFQRVSDAVWKNSYGDEFFASLDGHIQVHFPKLVIPTIVEHFREETNHAVGEVIKTCYAQVNNSEEKYKEACAALKKQNAELQQFLDQSKQILLQPFSELSEGSKNISDLTRLLKTMTENLAKTAVFQGKITVDQLSPLVSWHKALNENSIGILQGVKQSLDSGKRNFSNTYADRLSEREQRSLSDACSAYLEAIKANDKSQFEKQLKKFLTQISEVIFDSLGDQIRQENKRIHDTVELIMKGYLYYLQDGIKHIASECNFNIAHCGLNEIKTPEINLSSLFADIKIIEVDSNTGAVLGTAGWIASFTSAAGIWAASGTVLAAIGLAATPVGWIALGGMGAAAIAAAALSDATKQSLPNAELIYNDGQKELSHVLALLAEPFSKMINNYIKELTDTVTKEQEQMLLDINTKLEQARQGPQNDHEKEFADWQPLHTQAQQFNDEWSQLTDMRSYR